MPVHDRVLAEEQHLARRLAAIHSTSPSIQVWSGSRITGREARKWLKILRKAQLPAAR